MKLKYFFIALVAMVACFSEAFAQQVITVSNAEELKQALKEAGAAPQARQAAQGGAPTYTGLKVTLDQYEDASLIDGYFDLKSELVLDLNGYVVYGNMTIEEGQLSIIDNKGTGAWIGCITVEADATLAVGSGNVIAGESGVAVINEGTLSTDGGAVIGKITNNGSMEGVAIYNTALVANTAVAQAALNAAIDGQTVQFASDIEGDLTVVQKPNTKITIDGAIDDTRKTLKGAIIVDGKSSAYASTGVTIKNLNFDATGISKDASINLGDGSTATRYTSNVSIDGCTFTDTDYTAVAVKSYTAGDKNLTINECEVVKMHSLLQAANITGITITGCTATTKNGINLNSSSDVKIENNTVNVQGYAVRAGVSGGTSGKIELTNNTLKSANADGDAVVVLRGTAPAQADLSMTENVVLAATHISGTTASTKISAEANYWNGEENPVVAGGSAPVVVNSYYADKEKSDLQRNEMGSIYAYVMADRIFGDVTTNAKGSLVINVYGEDGSQIGTCTAEKAENLTAKPKTLTWRMNFGADDSDSWKMEWADGAPSINNMPAKVQVVVDGVALGEAEVKLTQNGDGQNPVFAAKTKDGKISSFIVSEGFGFSKAAATLVSAAAEDDNIVILEEGTYTVPTGKNNLTITGKADGVVKFDNIGARNMGGASVTFNNVTFDYYPNVNYTGLQHSGNLVYNNCTIDGQVFLYGASETFNNCIFNQNSSDAYNVWTYGAKEVAFNNCTFNSAGKSVLIYSDQPGTFNDVAVAGCTFKATTAVEGKAAIEMDSQISSGINLTIDAATTATGFGEGNVSGNSLWNNKKGNDNNANNDITVTVKGETVLAPTYEAKIGETGHRKFQEAINAVKNGETITLVDNIADDVTLTEKVGLYYTIDGAGKTMNGKMTITPLSDENNNRRITIKNIKFENTADAARDFISSAETNHYPRLTVEGCTFTGNGKQTDVALRLKTAYGAVIKNCTATGMHSFLQNTAGKDLTIEKVTVTNSKSAFALGTVQGVTVKGCEANVAGYGIRLDANTYNNNAVIESNNFKAFIPVVVRNANTESNITFNGTNTMTANNTDGIWCAIGTSEYEANGQMPTAATGKVKVALNDTGLNAEGVYGDFIAVAAIGEEEYDNLQKAINAVKNGETITLVGDIADDVTISQTEGVKFTLDGAAKTYTGTITVDGKSAAYATAGVTIKNLNFDATANSKDVCINLGNGNTNTRYVSNVTVEGCTFTDNDKTAVGVKSYTGGDKNLVITGCTATGMHSLVQVKNVENVTVAGSTITDSKNGVSLGASSNAVVENSTMDCAGYGVRVDASVSTTLTVKDAEISAFIPVVARNATANYNVAFNGANTKMNATNTDGIWCAIGATEYETNGTLPTAATGKVNVTLNDTGLKIEGVYGNAGVASIGRVNYPTFAAALDAVQNGKTITLVEGAEGDESKTEKKFIKDIEFTITGEAPKYALPVITFQNATVNIKDAEVLIPELDARQNATINVIDSKVVGVGGDDIIKSYYNGAINIEGKSEVYTMQVTTMGYINIKGEAKLNATWQTNVYGNGMITMAEGATFNTAALHLTGKDYSGRDNTDTERVGEPATIVVDGANFTVGKVTSNNGSDYSYNSKEGINIGTVDGKQALLDVKNGGAVNFYMANGQTTNFGADATVNVASSTLKTICRDENGTVTLANNGAVYVTGNSQLDVKKYSGNAIKVENANLTDSYFAGRVDAFGVNNLTGTTVIGDILGLGYETNPTEQVVVNITGNFTGTNVLVSTNNGVDNLLNVGKADAERTTVHFGQLGAFADVNVVNTDVTYGYAFIRNDFNATNSTFEIKGGVNTYFSGNAKVVLDNTTWSLPGYANIGSYGGYMYGNADVTLKNGSSMTATNLGIEVSGDKVVKLTLEDSSSLTATKLTNQGSIVLASVDATLISDEVGNVTTSVADHMAEWTDGTYKAVSASAKIGSTYYKTLQDAVKAVQDGETITLVNDVTENVTLTEKAGLYYTIDGAGKAMKGNITVNSLSDTNDNRRITIKNIKFVDGSDANVDFISSVNTNHYPRLTVEGCTFTGSGNDGDVAIRLKSSHSVVIKDCTGTGLHSFLQNTSGWNLTIENVKVTDSKSGLALGTVQGVTVKGCEADVEGYGIRLDANTYNNNAVIESNNVKAFIPVVVRKANTESNIEFKGTNTMTANNTDGIWCAIGTSEYEKNGEMPTAATGKVKVTLNDTGLNAEGIYGNALAGAGTEESPYIISNKTELIAFRNSVNAGETKYNAAGVWFALGADIDLAGENWVGIGSATADHGFMGNFDGKNFKIKNLTITNLTPDSDGYAYAGLFGVTEGTDKDNQNTIKNLTIENVTITTDGHIAAAAVAYPYYTIIDNVKVCGDIKIQGGDYTAGVLAYTRRCVNASNLSIVGNDGSYVKGNITVGGVISDIQMNGGLTADYKNFSAEGLTISGEKSVGGISGIISLQTLVGATVKNVTLVCNNASVGIVSGSWGDVSTISNVTYENVTGATAIVGATYKEGNAVEAKIGDTYYATLEAAYKAAQEGATVELLAPVVIASGETLTLDKNVTVVYTSNVAGEDMFTNRGTLNISAGTITYANTDATASNVTVSTISSEPGSVLNITGGTVENKTVKADGSSIYSFAIDMLTNGNLGDVTATIAGGTVSSDYMAIRQFNNGTACKNTLNITGGHIYGAKRAVQIHMDNNAAVTAISGGKIEAGKGGYALCNFAKTSALSVTDGEFIGAVYSASEKFISGGIYDAEVYDGYLANGYVCQQNENGTYGINFDPVAQIGDTYYATLRKAVEAAKSEETVKLLKNVTLEGGYDDAEEGLRIEKAINIAGWGHTIDCANFKKGIRVYNNGTTVNKVQFTSVTIVNNVVNGRCIDTRSANLYLQLSQANLTATNGNSQPLTIGGNDATYKVEMFGTKINAGNSGYGVICFVPVTNGISASSSDINGLAAFYIKHDASEFTLNIGSDTYTGSNMHSAESGFFGTVVVEGKDNKINVVGNGAIIKAVAGNDATQASQAAFLIRGAGNTINFQNTAAQIVTEGANAYEVAVKSDIAASTKLIKGGKEQTLVAESNEYQFYSLEEAVRFAGNNGTTKVVSDIELAQTLTIAADDTKTLDLNGKTISANITEQLTKSFAAICNKGTLTVMDASADAPGKISVSYAGNTFGYGMGLYTISNEGGVLNIEGGIIENLCTVSGSMYDAIDNNSTLGETVLNISGGSVVCEYIGIRQFANSTTANNVVNISGGNIKGGNTSIWMQNPNSKANKATLTITGADYENKNYPTIEGRLLAGESAGFVFDVKGGLFNTDVNDFCAPDYASYDFGNGTWGVESTNIESLDIVDGKLTEFVNQNEKTVGTLTYTRTFSSTYQGVWMALYVPFEIPVSELTDMGYEVAYFNDFRETLNADGEIIEGKSVIEMVKIKRGTLKANYPYAIKAPKMEDGTSVTLELVLDNVTLYSTTGERETVECSSATKRFTFSGTYKKGTKSDIVGSNDIPFYALYETGMSAMGETAKLGAFRVYMTITMKNGEPYIADNSGQAAHARAIPLRVIGEEDENGATIIYDVVEDSLNNNGDDYIYDLQGRRVSEPKKGGIYIKNGKKILY